MTNEERSEILTLVTPAAWLPFVQTYQICDKGNGLIRAQVIRPGAKRTGSHFEGPRYVVFWVKNGIAYPTRKEALKA